MRLGYDVGDLARHLRVRFVERLSLALHVLVHDRHVVAAAVGRVAGQHLVHDDAEAVDVGALVDLLAEDLLGRHVFRRADDVARLRELRVAALRGGGDAEVHDLEQPRVVDQDVRGLQVAMDDALLVRDAHADADVRAVGDGLLRRHRLLVGDLGAERMRRKVLHRDRVAAADVQEVVDADDVLVRDAPRVAQLVHEALQHLLVGGDVGVQELQDQALLDDGVLDENDGAERAFADLLDELVAALDHVAVLQRVQIERRRLGRRRRRLPRRGLRRAACAPTTSPTASWRRGAGGRGRRVVVARACVAAGVEGGAVALATVPAKVAVLANRPLGDKPAVELLQRFGDGARRPFRRRLARSAGCRAAPLRPAARRRVARPRRSPRRGPPSRGAAGTAAPCRGCLWSPSLPTAAMATGKRTIVLGHHLEQRRQRFRVADLGQRVGGALADPPVLVARRLDELVDGALVAAGDSGSRSPRGGCSRPCP